MIQIQRTWEKTAGYKTKFGGVLYILLEIFKLLFPDVLNDVGEKVVKYAIELIMLTGGLDWAWRNRKEVLQWIANIFRTKQKKK
jgi:hypothetical protein